MISSTQCTKDVSPVNFFQVGCYSFIRGHTSGVSRRRCCHTSHRAWRVRTRSHNIFLWTSHCKALWWYRDLNTSFPSSSSSVLPSFFFSCPSNITVAVIGIRELGVVPHCLHCFAVASTCSLATVMFGGFLPANPWRQPNQDWTRQWFRKRRWLWRPMGFCITSIEFGEACLNFRCLYGALHGDRNLNAWQLL